jgi:hypothetical protein
MLSASELNQLTLILLLATILFVLASALPQKVATSVLLMIAPFQLIDTRFGTSSIVLAYVVFIAALLRKERMQLPMLPHFLFLLLWYMISMSLMEPSTYIQHGVYLFSLVSAFLVFWLCYDLVNRFQDPSKAVTVFIVANVFVLIYCAIQLWIGPGERMYLFGIRDIYMTRVRADGRLTGPFESAEITAQYLVLMQFLLIHQFWHAKPGLMRKGIAVIGALNVLCLLATGSRGEFLLLVGGLGLYLWFFRRRLGTARAAALACVYGGRHSGYESSAVASGVERDSERADHRPWASAAIFPGRPRHHLRQPRLHRLPPQSLLVSALHGRDSGNAVVSLVGRQRGHSLREGNEACDRTVVLGRPRTYRRATGDPFPDRRAEDRPDAAESRRLLALLLRLVRRAHRGLPPDRVPGRRGGVEQPRLRARRSEHGACPRQGESDQRYRFPVIQQPSATLSR